MAAIDPELLLRQTSWLRALAVELIGDAHGAEDAVQDVCVAALERPPRTANEAGLRAWLARVVRRRVATVTRTERRRRSREHGAARDECLPASADSVVRTELQRRLLDAVMALEPRDREVVVMRYFDDLPPRVIAARTGSTSAAVRSRLARALAVLRARLDRSCGSRGGWLAILANWVDPSAVARRSFAPRFGGLAVSAAVVVGAAWLVLASSPAVSPPTLADVRDSTARVGGFAARAAQPRREDAMIAAAATPRVTLSGGRVIDGSGVSVGGAEVSIAMDRVLTRVVAAADGGFAFSLYGEHAVLWIDDGTVKSLRSCIVHPATPADHRVLVVARARSVEGRVLDEHGAAVAGADVRLVVPDDAFAGLSVPMDAMLGDHGSAADHEHATVSELPAALEALVLATGAASPSARTGADGRFRLRGVPTAEDAVLTVRAAGYHTARRPLGAAGEVMAIALSAEPPARRSLRGTVVDRGGLPVAGAVVRWGGGEARAGERGEFAISTPSSPAPLVAAAPGWQPAVLENFGGRLPLGEAHVCLVLGGPARSISARLRRPDGAPCAGWMVKLLDGVVVDDRELPVVLAEDLSRGAPNRVRTRADGSFEMRGLRSGPYRVWAWNPRDLQSFESPPLEVGSRDVVLSVPLPARTRVRGVARSLGGLPLAGIEVALGLEVDDNGRGYRRSTRGRVVCTDARGHFDLGEVVMASMRLNASGPEVLDWSRPVERAGWHELELARRCRFRFEASPGLPVDAFSLLDVEGRPLRLYATSYRASVGELRCGLRGGESPVLTTSEAATTLVAFRAGVELGRRPIRLDPEKIEVLSY